jgi:hypothetical protein
MSKILADFGNDDSEEEIKMKGSGLVMHDNQAQQGAEAKGQIRKCRGGLLLQDIKVILTNKHSLVESKPLKELCWITKNMMNLELIFSTALHIQRRGGRI